MTRGNFVLITSDDNCNYHYYISTQFNGNMYIKSGDHIGHGHEILDTYTSDNISSVEEWKKYIDNFNQKRFNYNDTYMYREITEENRLLCERRWNCYDIFGYCPKRETCKIIHDFEGVENLFDITSYNYHSDYTYWLNLTEDDIEVKANNGIVRINSMGGAVFHFDDFFETEWDSGLIDPESSYDFADDIYVRIRILMDKNDYWNLTEVEAEDLIDNNCYNRKILGIYDSPEDLGKELISQYTDIPEWLEDFINYEDYGNHVMEDDCYYYCEFVTGRIAHLE